MNGKIGNLSIIQEEAFIVDIIINIYYNNSISIRDTSSIIIRNMLTTLWHYQPVPNSQLLLSNTASKLAVTVSNMLIMTFREQVLLLLNKGSFNKTEREYKAWFVGGGALVKNKAILKHIWASGFHNRTHWIPEWFYIHSHQLEQIIHLTQQEVMNAIESNPEREKREELTQEIFPWTYDSPILKASDIALLPSKFTWKILWKIILDQSKVAGIKIARLFQVDIPEKIWKKMQEADSVVFEPSKEEIDYWSMIRKGKKIKISNMVTAAQNENII